MEPRPSRPQLPHPPSAVLTPSIGGFGFRRTFILTIDTLYSHDRRTNAYMRRRTTEGMSKTEVIRCLKRYVAREVFSALQDSAEIIARAA